MHGRPDLPQYGGRCWYYEVLWDAHFTIDMLVCLLFMVASKRCQLSHNKIHSIKVLLDFMGGFTPQC